MLICMAIFITYIFCILVSDVVVKKHVKKFRIPPGIWPSPVGDQSKIDDHLNYGGVTRQGCRRINFRLARCRLLALSPFYYVLVCPTRVSDLHVYVYIYIYIYMYIYTYKICKIWITENWYVIKKNIIWHFWFSKM